MSTLHMTEASIQPIVCQVEVYEKTPCPRCGVHPAGMVFTGGETLETPLLRTSPWADAVRLSGTCPNCGAPLYEVEISAVADAPPGMTLLNDHSYTAASHTLHVASRGRRAWNLVHLTGIRKLSFCSLDPATAQVPVTTLDTPWLDEHVFGPMAWSDGWKSAVKLTDTMLPYLRRIAWPENS